MRIGEIETGDTFITFGIVHEDQVVGVVTVTVGDIQENGETRGGQITTTASWITDDFLPRPVPPRLGFNPRALIKKWGRGKAEGSTP